MASTMDLYLTIEDAKTNNYSSYENEKNVSFLKIQMILLDIIVEFDNLDKDKKIELGLDFMIKEIYKF